MKKLFPFHEHIGRSYFADVGIVSESSSALLLNMIKSFTYSKKNSVMLKISILSVALEFCISFIHGVLLVIIVIPYYIIHLSVSKIARRIPHFASFLVNHSKSNAFICTKHLIGFGHKLSCRSLTLRQGCAILLSHINVEWVCVISIDLEYDI